MKGNVVEREAAIFFIQRLDNDRVTAKHQQYDIVTPTFKQPLTKCSESLRLLPIGLDTEYRPKYKGCEPREPNAVNYS